MSGLRVIVIVIGTGPRYVGEPERVALVTLAVICEKTGEEKKQLAASRAEIGQR